MRFPFAPTGSCSTVRFHHSGAKRLNHPLVGDLTLSYELLDIPGELGLTLVTHAAEPGTTSQNGSSS